MGVPARIAPIQPRSYRREALAIEAEAIDHRLIPHEAEQARARIAGLRQWRDRADLGKAKAKRKDRIELPVRYALIVSLRTPEQNIDLYSPIAVELQVPIETAIPAM